MAQKSIILMRRGNQSNMRLSTCNKWGILGREMLRQASFQRFLLCFCSRPSLSSRKLLFSNLYMMLSSGNLARRLKLLMVGLPSDRKHGVIGVIGATGGPSQKQPPSRSPWDNLRMASKKTLSQFLDHDFLNHQWVFFLDLGIFTFFDKI